ncbi:MBL fold metallo-hydrolase [Gordonia amarae]|uniref:Metallo-beta-lactamase domain-containing protein n=2 Tax=Gordonia amarae TaxID=36821 RepID=G7GSL1_9ACTN|nr:MBL fold metallo-hydrolase [Gordonia amarae]MCS3879431.1 glyoxylase-like metal-dependent hydrolase (beta-lactamase superfamily II) [Gordonia amarae]QHN17905.1 MBL fold metallo-hydrolase [Gordonia amarae]QHN22427.1 MBL fold metallo-hydrolase [Gordonia amarae]QHN31303.1 MBL fold metallo-hydrolase [Gordonia amarae]QHN40048.1 MBL fold metallo-hydrolase [Gordonia amarae]
MTSPPTTISDTYTGDLSESPEPQRRTLGSATIVKLSVGPMDNNVYLVTSRATGDQLIIDAANDADRILATVAASDGRPALLLTTHQHFDHWQALAEVSSALKVPTAAGRLDAAELPVTPDRLVDDGDTIVVGDLTFDAIHLVGHTPGSIALALTDGGRGERSDGESGTVHLFSGDCLFPGGVGKTWKEGDFEILLGDVTRKVFDRYPDDTVVYPGHGKDTTLGAERPHLDEWRERGW